MCIDLLAGRRFHSCLKLEAVAQAIECSNFKATRPDSTRPGESTPCSGCAPAMSCQLGHVLLRVPKRSPNFVMLPNSVPDNGVGVSRMDEVLLALVRASGMPNPVKKEATTAIGDFRKTHEHADIRPLRERLSPDVWDAVRDVSHHSSYFV